MNDTEKRITAKMVLDTTGYNDSVKGVNAEMQKYQSQIQLASQGIKSFGADSEKLKNVQQSLSKQIELHTKKVDIYKQSIEKSTEKLNNNIKKRDGLKTSLESANKKYDEAIALYGKESTEAKKAKEKVDKLKEAHESAEKAVESNAKQVQGYETKLNKAQSQLVKTQGELKEVSSELDKNTNKWAKASEQLEAHSKKLKSVGKSMSDFGKKLTTHVSLPLMGIGALASKVGMDFEAGMSKVQAISGATGDDLDKLKNIAEEMGSKTKFSATESAKGLEYMAMAGWKTEEMLAGLPPILDLATAAGADLGTTSDIVTDALTAFGLKASDAAHFADVLAKASSSSNTNVELMGETFTYVAPLAGALGYSIEDTATAIGLMANAGIKGSKAGTSLRSIITRLTKPTKEVYSAFEKLGLATTTYSTSIDTKKIDKLNTSLDKQSARVKKAEITYQQYVSKYGEESAQARKALISLEQAQKAVEVTQGDLSTTQKGVIASTTEFSSLITDAQGNMKPFSKVITVLRKNFAELTLDEKAETAALLGGQEAMSGLLAIVNASDEDFSKLSQAINDCDGATAKMAETMQDNAKGSITEMKSALEGAGIKVFETLAPHITNFANKVTELANKFSELSPEMQEMIVKMGAMAIVGGPAISGIGKLTSGIGGLLGGVGKASKLLGGLTTATKGLGMATATASGATSIATTGIGGLGVAAKAGTLLLNPWVLGISAVAAGGLLLAKHLSKDAVPSIDLFKKKVETSTEIIDANGNTMTIAGTKMVEFSEKTKKAVGGFVTLSDGAKKALTDLYISSTKITNDTVTELTSKYKEMGEQIKAGEDEKYQQRLSSFEQFLENNKNMSLAEKSRALQSMKDKHAEEIQETDKYVADIQAILQKASDEKRALTLEEQQEINDIQEKMKETGIKKLSETEEESNAILGRIKDYGTRITTEQASEIIKNAETQRRESVQKATDQYNQTVAEIRKMCDEDKIITAEQADAMIADAERQKNDSIDKAEGMKTEVVKKIGEMNEDTLKQIDDNDGHIKTKWEELKAWFENNPIIRWIKTKTSGSKHDDADRNWTGNQHFMGGFTYLHDAPGKSNNYELYDLPRGTRIYNHDASEDLVLKTAEMVATKVANMTINGSNGRGGIAIEKLIVTSPTPSPSEVARQTKNSLQQLALQF